jgi:dolichol-phosphate mannosyltransferase
MKTLVVMPTFNEAKTIEGTISDVLFHCPNVDLVVVDDNSPDGTQEIVRLIADRDSRIKLLSRAAKLGLGPAYLEGFQFAFERDYELIVEMDADGSHRAEDLVKLLKAAEGADLVIGSRWIAGGEVVNWPRVRQWISRTGNGYARFMLRTSIFDMTSGFRVFRADFLNQLELSKVASTGYSFQVELAYMAAQRGRVVEVPIRFIERVDGSSKMTLRIVIEALLRVTKWGLARLFR